MCGLFGYSIKDAKINDEQRAMMLAILAVSADTRGGDSFGAWYKGGIIKGLGEITAAASKLTNIDHGFFHTRKATSGGITTANAHPFEIGNIIGAHNGIITNHSELNEKYKRNFTVDSMHLFGHINENLPFDDIHGYGSIEWINKKHKNRIYLCKLAAGELSVFGIGKNIKNYKGVVWSSNDDHTKAALKAAGIDAFEFNMESEVCYFVENGQYYYSLENGEKKKFSLAKRETSSYMPDWRDGLNTWSSRNDNLTSEQYEDIIDSMDEQEEKKFRELWELEEEEDIGTLIESEQELEKSLEDEEFMYSHALNDNYFNDEEDLEFIQGKGWIRMASNSSAITKTGIK